MKKSVSKRSPHAARIRELSTRVRAVAEGVKPARASLEHALLGLIAEMPGITGYDIVKVFALSMQHYWHAHQGQIYPTLERMVRGGLIHSREIIQRGRPNKRTFTIAPAGRRMLVQWLESPIEELRIKHSQLMRTRFLGHLGPDGARTKIGEQRAGWARRLEELRSIERMFFKSGHYPDVNDMFGYFTLRYGIQWMEESIRWCDWAIGEVERNRGLFDSAAAGQAGCATAANSERARPGPARKRRAAP
jgi:PadR family transcriptional regulator AphA